MPQLVIDQGQTREGSAAGARAAAAFRRLEAWIDRTGWEGPDLCDVKATPLFMWLGDARHRVRGVWRIAGPVLAWEERNRALARRIFRAKTYIYPQALALLARGYLRRARETDDEALLDKARQCLGWLIDHPSRGYRGACWGQPYDWASRERIPAHTPRATVTSIVVHALLDAYEGTSESRYLEVAASAGEFYAHDLHHTVDDEGDLCFSYTACDRFRVHNANMVAAAALARIWRHDGGRQLLELSQRAARFTAKHQNADGSWYYWAPPDKLAYTIDNYHTGFVLEAYECIRECLGEEFAFGRELEAGLGFYGDRLFTRDGVPKLLPDATYPIDIQSCAQSIITFASLSGARPELLARARSIADWTLDHMCDASGYFYYRMDQDGRIDRTAYIRWAESWMLYALALVAGGD